MQFSHQVIEQKLLNHTQWQCQDCRWEPFWSRVISFTVVPLRFRWLNSRDDRLEQKIGDGNLSETETQTSTFQWTGSTGEKLNREINDAEAAEHFDCCWSLCVKGNCFSEVAFFFLKTTKVFFLSLFWTFGWCVGGSIRKWGNDERRCFHTQLIGSGSGARLGNRKLLPACLSPLLEEPDQYETQKTTPNRGRVGKRVSNFLHVTDYISSKRHFLYHETQTAQQTSKNKQKNCCLCRSRPHFHRFQVSMLNGCTHS